MRPGITLPCDVVNFSLSLTRPPRTMAVNSASVIGARIDG
jgi:hypothetical protein